MPSSRIIAEACPPPALGAAAILIPQYGSQHPTFRSRSCSGSERERPRISRLTCGLLGPRLLRRCSASLLPRLHRLSCSLPLTQGRAQWKCGPCGRHFLRAPKFCYCCSLGLTISSPNFWYRCSSGRTGEASNSSSNPCSRGRQEP